jgi:hypothetical protein
MNGPRPIGLLETAWQMADGKWQMADGKRNRVEGKDSRNTVVLPFVMSFHGAVPVFQVLTRRHAATRVCCPCPVLLRGGISRGAAGRWDCDGLTVFFFAPPAIYLLIL